LIAPFASAHCIQWLAPARCDVRRRSRRLRRMRRNDHVGELALVSTRFVGFSCRSAARHRWRRSRWIAAYFGHEERVSSFVLSTAARDPDTVAGYGGASHDRTRPRSTVRQVRSRRCSRAGCPNAATSTLTYAYRDSTAVLGPLANQVEPHCYDLCQSHAQTLSAPRGWEVIRLAVEQEPKPSTDDLLALADAVRDAGLSYDPPAGTTMEPPPRHNGLVELARRGHLTVLADPGAS
jgi:hypothetical protein